MKINGVTAGMGTNRRISVIGAGPSGLSMAAEIESHGFDVLVYAHPDHATHATRIAEKGCMDIVGVMNGSMSPKFTFEMKDVVAFSNVMILAVPSTGQETVLTELKPFCMRYHIAIAIPGNMFSLVAERAGILFACVLETNMSPYSCRLTERADLLVCGKKTQFHIAASRPNVSDEFKERIAAILPTIKFEWCHSVVEVSLNNINGTFHPLMMLMNAGRIEDTTSDFMLYQDGLTPSVAAAISALDRVRIDIGAAFGFQLRSTRQTSNDCYNQDFPDLVSLARNSKPHNRLRAPPGMGHRNLVEDVPDVLVFWHDLAVKLGIDASPVAAVIVLSGMAMGVDFMKQGRSLERLNLASCTRAQLVEWFGNTQQGLASSL